MDLVYIYMILFYGLFLSGVVYLAGSYIVRVFVTGPSGSDKCFLCGEKKNLGETAAQYIFLVSILTFLASSIHFILHCSFMTETPLNEVFSILPAFITKTKYGRFTILRTILLAAIIIISFFVMRRDQNWAKSLGIVFSCILLVVMAMSGHQGVKGYLNIRFFLDSFHLIAVSVWIGGLFFINFCLSVFIKDGRVDYWHNLTSLVNRYSELATYCVFITVLTGIALTYFNVKNFSIFIDTEYGLVLLAKILLVGITMMLGGINKFFVIRAINNTHIESRSAEIMPEKKLLNLVSIEASLGFVILLLTSLLTHLSPEG